MANNPVTPRPDPKGVQAWLDALDRNEQLVLAELRQKIGPDGDLKQAYREWYEQQMLEHDRVLINMLRRLKEADRQASK